MSFFSNSSTSKKKRRSTKMISSGIKWLSDTTRNIINSCCGQNEEEIEDITNNPVRAYGTTLTGALIIKDLIYMTK